MFRPGLLVLMMFLGVLSGCGAKGDLYLADETQQEQSQE